MDDDEVEVVEIDESELTKNEAFIWAGVGELHSEVQALNDTLNNWRFWIKFVADCILFLALGYAGMCIFLWAIKP